MQATYNTDHWLLEALFETPKQTKENFKSMMASLLFVLFVNLWHFDTVPIHRLKEGPRSVQN
jgi:hypothetical protein